MEPEIFPTSPTTAATLTRFYPHGISVKVLPGEHNPDYDHGVLVGPSKSKPGLWFVQTASGYGVALRPDQLLPLLKPFSELNVKLRDGQIPGIQAAKLWLGPEDDPHFDREPYCRLAITETECRVIFRTFTVTIYSDWSIIGTETSGGNKISAYHNPEVEVYLMARGFALNLKADEFLISERGVGKADWTYTLDPRFRSFNKDPELRANQASWQRTRRELEKMQDEDEARDNETQQDEDDF